MTQKSRTALSALGWLLGLGSLSASLTASVTGSSAPGSAELRELAPAWALGDGCPAQPRRVASVSLNSDELLLRLLPFDRWSSASSVIDWPSVSVDSGRVPRSIPRVHGQLEQLLGLQPDLVLLSDYNSAELYSQLRSARICTHYVKAPSSFAELFKVTLELGRVLGLEDKTQHVVDEQKALLKAAIDQHAHHRQLRLALLSDRLAYGLHTLNADCLRLGGYQNGLAELGLEGANSTNVEQLLSARPQVLACSAPVPSLRWATPEQVPSSLPLAALLQASGAQLLAIPENQMSSMSLNAVQSCVQLLELLDQQAP